MEYTAYLRVSTSGQKQSGLGLQAQEDAIRSYVEQENGTLLQVFTEVASGGDIDRPILKQAIDACKKSKSILISYKLDRIARSVSKIAEIMDGNVDFISLDVPQGDFLTTSLLSVLGEHEKRIIGQRTSAALQVLARNGKQLGFANECRNDAIECNRISVAVRSAKANTNAVKLRTTVNGYIAQGITSTVKIAQELNKAGLRTGRGSKFKPTTVNRLLKRLDALAA